MKRIDGAVILALTVVIITVIGAFVALAISGHSSDAYRAGSYIVQGIGFLASIGVFGYSKIQIGRQIRDEVEKARADLRNGAIKDPMKEALHEAGIRPLPGGKRANDPPVEG